MSKNYDLIATVDIDIASPISDDASFDNLLIVGPLPAKAPEKAPASVGVYASLDEVVEAGWAIDGETPDPIGVAAKVAFSQSPKPTKIYIAPIQMSGDAPETALATVQRAIATPGWYALCTAGVASTEYESIASYIETQEKVFIYTELEFFGKGKKGENEAYVKDIYYRSYGVYGRQRADQPNEEIPEANKYINVALAAKWLSYDAGSETSAFKVLAAVSPSELTSSEIKALKDGNLNFFITVGGKNITMNGKVMAGEWADVIRFRDWLKNDMQVRVINTFILNPKIPYVDTGIGLIQNQMLASLKAGQDAGGIAEDEFDADGNKIPGYVTSVPLSSSLTEMEKASRQLPRCRFKARLAGAIHFAEIDGSLTYSL